MDRIRAVLKNLCKFLHAALFNLNIFSLQNFGSNIDREKVKYLCRWATRLYIVLFMIGVFILAIYTLLQPDTLTETFVNPSIKTYDRLILEYGDKLQCPCSSISSAYDRFIQIQPVFHEVNRNIYL